MLIYWAVLGVEMVLFLFLLVYSEYGIYAQLYLGHTFVYVFIGR